MFGIGGQVRMRCCRRVGGSDGVFRLGGQRRSLLVCRILSGCWLFFGLLAARRCRGMG